MKRDFPPTPVEYERTTRRIDAIFRPISTPTGIKRFSDETRQMHGIFDSFATLVNPLDRTTGEANLDPEATEHARRLGSMTGLLLAQYAYEPDIMTWKQVFSGKLKIGTTDQDDAAHSRHIAAQEVVSIGERGLDIIGPEASDWLEELEDETISDVRCRRIYRLGAGVVLYFAQAAFIEMKDHEMRQDLRQFAYQLEHGASPNWDALLED